MAYRVLAHRTEAAQLPGPKKAIVDFVVAAIDAEAQFYITVAPWHGPGLPEVESTCPPSIRQLELVAFEGVLETGVSHEGQAVAP